MNISSLKPIVPYKRSRYKQSFLYAVKLVKGNGKFHNCQLWSLITVHGFNPMDLGYIIRWQFDLVNTNESVLPVWTVLHKQMSTTE